MFLLTKKERSATLERNLKSNLCIKESGFLSVKQQMGFWAVLAFVISSQVGSGVFLLSHNMAPYGTLGVFSWFVAGAGVLALAFVFARLAEVYPQTGGPHVYVTKAFGHVAGFYVAFSYWVLAWLSSTPVLGTIASSMCELLGVVPNVATLFVCEVMVLGGLTLLNLRGVEASGRWEVVMSALKAFPLVIFPVIALLFLDVSHFQPLNPTIDPWYQVVSQAGVMTLWGFLGIEAITAPAGSIKDPKITIPKALKWGVLITTAIYVLNHVALMGLMPLPELQKYVMPYGVALQKMWGAGSSKVMSFFVILVCVGAMNAWVLAMGQIAKGAAEMGFFPPLFAKENKFGAPVMGLWISSGLLFLCLLGLMSRSFGEQIRFIIGISIGASIGIYGLCVAAYVKEVRKHRLGGKAYGIAVAAVAFCIWMAVSIEWESVLWALLIPLAGVPFYYTWRVRDKACVVLS